MIIWQNNQTYNTLFPTLNSFKDNLIPLSASQEFYQTDNYFDTDIWNILWQFFKEYFEGLWLKSPDNNFNLKKFHSIFLDYLPSFYLQQQLFIKNDFKDLQDWENRGSSNNTLSQGSVGKATGVNQSYTWIDKTDKPSNKSITLDEGNSYRRVSDTSSMLRNNLNLGLSRFADKFLVLFTHNLYTKYICE